MLESLGEQFGHVLKIDDYTMNYSRVKFARLCVEIDLCKQIKKGF